MEKRQSVPGPVMHRGSIADGGHRGSIADAGGQKPIDMAVSDLAKEARKENENRPWYQKISLPLLVVVPALIVSMLTALLVPVCYTLIASSAETTSDLSTNMLAVMVNNTRMSVEHSIGRLNSTLRSFGSLNEVGDALTTPPMNDYKGKTELIKIMAQTNRQSRTDSTTCYTARWKSPLSDSSPITVDNIEATVVTVFKNFTGSWDTQMVGIKDFGMPNWAAYLYYMTDQDEIDATKPVIPQATEAKPYDVTNREAIQQLLRTSTQPNYMEFFGLNYVAITDFWNILLAKVFTAPSTGTRYACQFGMGLTSTWSGILERSRIYEQTVTTVLNRELVMFASSARVAGWTGTGDSNLKWENETISPALTQSVISKFGSVENIDLNQITQYEGNIDGKQNWIIMVTGVRLSPYLDDNWVLVSATPRTILFGKVDKAKKRSMGIAIGLGVGMTCIVSGLFLAISLPLRRLAAAMELLTKLDFGALEKGNILGTSSVFSEVRRVQFTFTTMVKAFAGGIKKNREIMVTRNLSTVQSQTGAKQSPAESKV